MVILICTNNVALEEAGPGCLLLLSCNSTGLVFTWLNSLICFTVKTIFSALGEQAARGAGEVQMFFGG